MTRTLLFVAGALAAAAVATFGCASGARAEEPPMPRSTKTTTRRTADTELTVERWFAAPPARVFAGLTDPALLRRWMSAAGRELAECTVDLRTGGSYRYGFRSARGTFGMYGTYREVVPDRRIVHTESYDGYTWEPLVTTTELRADAGGTAMVMTIRYPSKAVCDSDSPNVEGAAAEGFARMEQVLGEQAQER